MPASFIDISVEISPQVYKTIKTLFDGGALGRSVHGAFKDFSEEVYDFSRQTLSRKMRGGQHVYTNQLVNTFSILKRISHARGPGERFTSGLSTEAYFVMGWPEGSSYTPRRANPPRRYATPFDRGSSPAGANRGEGSFNRILNWVIEKNIKPRYARYRDRWTPGHWEYTGYKRYARYGEHGREEYVKLHRTRVGAGWVYRRATQRIVAFFIWRKIMREGTSPTNVVSEMEEETFDYVNRSGAAIVQEIARRLLRELRG